MTSTSPSKIKFNHIHKRFVLLYDGDDMRQIWKRVRREWKKEKKSKLPKRFGKYPEIWEELNIWIEEKIAKLVGSGQEDVTFYNKQDLKDRGWDDKIISILYPRPDRVIYLGRGRYAYYYNGNNVSELEDSEKFIEYISAKLERKEHRKQKKLARDNPLNAGFGSEFIR